MSPQQPSFSVHIEDGEPHTHRVAAAVLAQILDSAQHAFALIGMHVEGREIKARARIPASISQHFQLVCHLPAPGSYAVPVSVGGADDLFGRELAQKAFDIFREVGQAVSARDSVRLANGLPNERIRRRLLETFKSMAPRADARWKLALHDDQDVSFATFDRETIAFVDETLVPAEQREAARTVTGELKSIDFAERKVTIIYPPTSKELACIYQEEIEDLLYERRRDLIQVTGRVLLDDQGDPKQIIDVTDIRDLDLSDLILDTVRHGGLILNATPALTLEPSLDETKQLLFIEHDALGIDVYATTREALLTELHEQVAMLWHEYAQAPDADLDTPARQLKQALLAQFTPAADAP
jgi:hypothetical protein